MHVCMYVCMYVCIYMCTHKRACVKCVNKLHMNFVITYTHTHNLYRQLSHNAHIDASLSSFLPDIDHFHAARIHYWFAKFP